MKIVIIGAGSVGTNLHHAFSLKGIHTELVHARPTAQGQWITASDREPVVNTCPPPADIYIYAVADNALAEVVARVEAPRALHLHTSGSMPIDVFGPDKPHAGVLYFFQSFSRTLMIDDWSSIPVFIEGRNIDDVAAVYSLAQNLTGRIYECTQHDRERLHVAGVFANNYTNLMYRIAAEMLRGTQIPFQALLPLIDQTAVKVHTLAPANAQTGPAQRGDRAVMNHHLEILKTMPDGAFSHADLYAVYQALGALIGTGRTDPNPPKQ